MRIVCFYHSLVSDWNHGNAHFLRGVVWELKQRGHNVKVYEPRRGWSLQNLMAEHKMAAIRSFQAAYPGLESEYYDPGTLDLDEALDGADLVLVHEWNDPDLVRRIGTHRAVSSYRLLFHDTHHRSVTDPAAMKAYDLRHYDGVLAFGESVRERYLRSGWAKQAWTWHEAADVRIFHPIPEIAEAGDVVWVGNWGDEERSAELREFLFDPVQRLGLRAKVYGVRYPQEALDYLSEQGVEYCGWTPNFRVPELFAAHRFTVHVPRRPYREPLRGVPTIRVFEALACGTPLVCAPWEDTEGLFRPGEDYLIARDGREMERHMKALVKDKEMARELGARGRERILERHTCAHRVDELLRIARRLGVGKAPAKTGNHANSRRGQR